MNADDHMETESEAIERLTGAGFERNLWIDDDGRVTSGGNTGDTGDTTWDPADLTVSETVRFEGTSNPDDEAILLAISLGGEPLGVLSTPYGPDVSAPQADAIRQLDA